MAPSYIISKYIINDHSYLQNVITCKIFKSFLFLSSTFEDHMSFNSFIAENCTSFSPAIKYQRKNLPRSEF